MHRGSLAALLLAGTAGSAAFGQDAAGGLISATISERLEANSNYGLDDPSPGTSYFADTRLSLGYLNETQTQTFGLGLSTGARALWEAEQDFELTLASPTGGNLDYTNEWANAAFDAAFDYRQRLVNVNYFEEIDTDGDLLPDDLSQLQDDTREHRTDANVGLLLGTDAPSSYELRFIGNNIDYSEIGTNRTPRYTLEGLGTWQLQLTPVLASAVLVDYLYYNADNAENTEIRRSELSAGVVYEPNEFLRARGRPRLRAPHPRGHPRRGARHHRGRHAARRSGARSPTWARTSPSPATRCSPRRRRKPGSTRWCGRPTRSPAAG